MDTPFISTMGRFGIETFEGNYAVVGSNSGAVDEGLALILDTFGNVIQQRAIGGFCIQQTPDSGFIIIGNTLNYNSAEIVKLNSQLVPQWTKYYGWSSYQENFVYGEVTINNEFIFCGLIDNGNNTNAWLVKTGYNGDTLWTKSYGGNYDDSANEIHETSDGGFIMIGRKEANLADPRLYIIKTFSNGNIEWQRTYNNYLFGESIKQTLDGGYILTAWAYEGRIVKIDTIGNIIWELSTSDNIRFNSINQTSDGGYIAAGYMTSDVNEIDSTNMYVEKICNDGTFSWSRIYAPTNHYDEASSIIQTSDGGFLMCGFKNFASSDSLEPLAMYVIKTDGENIVCPCYANFEIYPDTILYHYIVENFAYGIEPISYIWSWGDGTYDSIPYPSHIYDTIGTYNICLTIMDTTGCSDTFCIDLTFKTDAQMGYISVIPPIINSVDNTIPDNIDFIIYPNPVNTEITVKDYIPALIRLCNTLGQTVLEAKKTNKLYVGSLPQGLYLLQLFDEKGDLVKTERVVKE